MIHHYMYAWADWMAGADGILGPIDFVNAFTIAGLFWLGLEFLRRDFHNPYSRLISVTFFAGGVVFSVFVVRAECYSLSFKELLIVGIFVLCMELLGAKCLSKQYNLCHIFYRKGVQRLKK